jgi:hypothetical protein
MPHRDEILSEQLERYTRRARACRAAAGRTEDQDFRIALLQVAASYDLLAATTVSELADPLWAHTRQT